MKQNVPQASMKKHVPQERLIKQNAPQARFFDYGCSVLLI